MTSRYALMIVDVQRDFCTGGALAVPGSEHVVKSLNRHIHEAVAAGAPVFASRDWHPAVTFHFAPFGGQWPVHCVAGTPGGAFHPDLRLPPDAIIISKGQDPGSPGYSAFEGTTAEGTPLRQALSDRGITELYIGGLATDYCVRHTVLDALSAGFRVTVLSDAIAGVDLHPGDVQRAIDEMRAAGASFDPS